MIISCSALTSLLTRISPMREAGLLGGRDEGVDQALDAGLYFIPNRPDCVNTLASWVFQDPVFIPLAGEVRAFITAAHGDDDVGFLDGFGGEYLRDFCGHVDAQFRSEKH